MDTLSKSVINNLTEMFHDIQNTDHYNFHGVGDGMSDRRYADFDFPNGKFDVTCVPLKVLEFISMLDGHNDKKFTFSKCTSQTSSSEEVYVPFDFENQRLDVAVYVPKFWVEDSNVKYYLTISEKYE